jgi:hypothetical protein
VPRVTLKDRSHPVFGLLLANAGVSEQNLSIFDPVSPPAESIRNLSVLVLAITGFIFINGPRLS